MAVRMREKIIQVARRQLAQSPIDGFAMRPLAKEVGIAQSVLYHYFPSKEVLLRAVFDHTNSQLGKARALLPETSFVETMLRQRVEFQLDHAEEIVAVIKYYLFFRRQFLKNGIGYVPDKTSLHIEEVIRKGIDESVFDPTMNVDKEARVITHAINGFLLEFYPTIPNGDEKDELIDMITRFVFRGIPKYAS